MRACNQPSSVRRGQKNDPFLRQYQSLFFSSFCSAGDAKGASSSLSLKVKNREFYARTVHVVSLERLLFAQKFLIRLTVNVEPRASDEQSPRRGVPSTMLRP